MTFATLPSRARAPHAKMPALWLATGYLPAAAIFLLAGGLQLLLPVNADVSWIITICEKVLDGAHLYTDILETNPPATVWLYMPPVLLAHLISLAPEVIVDLFIFTAAAASIFLCLRIVEHAGEMPLALKGRLAAAAALVLLVLPARTFAEREQIAVIAMAPYFVLAVVRIESRSVRLLHALLAGVGLGVAVSIKPHFVAAAFLAAIVLVWRRRDWRLVFIPEVFAGATIFLIYVAAALYFCPEYWRVMMPIVRAVYLPVRLPPMDMLLGSLSNLAGAALILIAMTTRGRADRQPYWVAFAAVAGFAAAFVLQGKGWPYHAYPMLAIGAFAALAAIITEPKTADAAGRAREIANRMLPWIPACALCAGVFWTMTRQTDFSALAEPVRQIKERPGIAVISEDLALAHPLVRTLGGTFVGRTCSQWIANNVMFIRALLHPDPTEQANIERLDRFDADLVADNLTQNKPDIVLVERAPVDFRQWAREHDNVEQALSTYRFVERRGDVEIFSRGGN